MADQQAQAEEFKGKGNVALTEGKIEEALGFYAKGLELDPKNHVIYSNRSAAYCRAKQFDEALDDAERVIEIKPDWAKGYSRKGAALASMNRFEEAMMAYMSGLDIDPSNDQIKKEITECKKHLTGPAGSQPLMNPFGENDIWSKLESNERTKEFCKDPDYRKIMEKLQSNPSELGKHMNDQRVMSSLGVILGVGDQLDGLMKDGNDEEEQTNKSTNGPTSTASKANAKEEPMQVDLTENQQKALKEKEAGNAAYKAKNFPTALEHYGKAIELDETNITFRTNRAAVYYEQKEYDVCIEECEKAIEVGRENRADFKLIAKAFARIGNAYHQKDDLANAQKYFNKSLSEHRASDIVKKALEVDKKLKARVKLEYINPEKSLEEKDKGNQCFKNGDYPSAIRHYSEAIKRNPEDPKIYSNRAACYTKLAEFGLALRDCEECIKIDPSFVKGYLRKGANLYATKEFSKAGYAYQKALDLDPNCQEAIDGYRKCMTQDNDPEAVKKKAMNDPEVQQILSDPAMQLILQQMQKDPKALQEHLKNPAIATKIQKLLESGLIAFR